MPPPSMPNFLRRLTRGMAAEASEEPDDELVRRFLATQEEAAFEILVRRHGPMVYRVCLRAAGHDQDAEDAFQATFLVLARSLRSLRNRASLASWLHGVARRVALKARIGAEARRRREQAAPATGVVLPGDAGGEVSGVLDEELARLPERLRLPLVLCYLEGRTQDEAARTLKWSKGTLRRRLDEARDTLADRLARRGVWLGVLAVVLVSECAAPAAIASQLLDPVLCSVTPDGRPAVAVEIPSRVLSLANGVSSTMLFSHSKLAAAIVLVLALGLPAGAWLARSQADPPKQVPPAGDRRQADDLSNKAFLLEALNAAELRNFSNTVSAPVFYKDSMLVLVTKSGAAAVVFTKEIDGGVEYKYRYESADGKTQKSGTGKVTEKDAPVPKSDLFIEAGPIPLRWSHADDGKAWIYYDPSVLKVHPAKAADFEDRTEPTPFDGPMSVSKLDLKRFQWK